MKRKRLLQCIERRYGGSTQDEIREFADFVGVSYGAVLKWLYNARTPRYPTMQRIERLTSGRMRVGDW